MTHFTPGENDLYEHSYGRYSDREWKPTTPPHAIVVSKTERKRRQREEDAQKRKLALNNQRVIEAWDTEKLGEICTMDTLAFSRYARHWSVDDMNIPENFYFHKDNGSKILFVAHLDSCESDIVFGHCETASGPIVFAGSLDDRLGAYIGLELLPKMGIVCDVLLTTGEETGRSTAKIFAERHPKIKEYNWIIEFDRGGTDCVLYKFEDYDIRTKVQSSGARVGNGSFSDICHLESLGCKAINWGVGYRDYHGPRSHAWLWDTWTMVGHFLAFYDAYKDEHLPHEVKVYDYPKSSAGGGYNFELKDKRKGGGLESDPWDDKKTILPFEHRRDDDDLDDFLISVDRDVSHQEKMRLPMYEAWWNNGKPDSCWECEGDLIDGLCVFCSYDCIEQKQIDEDDLMKDPRYIAWYESEETLASEKDKPIVIEASTIPADERTPVNEVILD